jgi:predicted nucleic acid-binding protein
LDNKTASGGLELKALLDTGFILAMLSSNDPRHELCLEIFAKEKEPLLPSPIFAELAYMVIRDLGYEPWIAFMRSVFAGALTIEWATRADVERAIEVMEKYEDARIDFADSAIVAMAERLNISRILTVDQRDFRLFRPRHMPAFSILP